MLENMGTLEDYKDILAGIKNSFLIGLEQYYLTHTFAPPNHCINGEHLEFLNSKYGEEIDKGRLSQGYTPKELYKLIGEYPQSTSQNPPSDTCKGHYRTAPLSIAETRPGKLRVIVNHSYPKSAKQSTYNHMHRKTEMTNPNALPPMTASIPLNPSATSINAVIDSKKFQCTWGSFSKCHILVVEALEGTQVAIFDVESAFRNVPIHPSVRPFTAVRLGDKVHLNPCLTSENHRHQEYGEGLQMPW